MSASLPLDELQQASAGPLYLELKTVIENAIVVGRLKHGDALPPERDIADVANISRVTVRKAIDTLVADGLLVRRRGSGTFVVKPIQKLQQPLSRLTSFTEDMRRRCPAAFPRCARWRRRSARCSRGACAAPGRARPAACRASRARAGHPS